MAGWRGLCAWLVVTVWSGAAVAAKSPQAESTGERGFSLAYAAPAGCPDAAALVQAIASRTPGATEQPVEVAGVRLRVELRADGTSGLWVELPEGTSRREFPTAACPDAVASIAVIASMVLEIDAPERAAAARSFMDPVADAASADAPAASAPPVTRPPRPATPTPTSELTRRPARQRSPLPSQPDVRIRGALSAGVLVESAVASSGAVGASVGVAIARERRASIWSPSVQAELIGTLTATERQPPQGDVELRLLAGRLSVCPLRFAATPRLSFMPCLTGDVGSLRAKGAGTTLNPKAPTMLWLAAGGAVHAQLRLSRLVSLESAVALRGLAQRDTFTFRPQIVAYQVPRWSFGAGLGLSLALP